MPSGSRITSVVTNESPAGPAVVDQMQTRGRCTGGGEPPKVITLRPAVLDISLSRREAAIAQGFQSSRHPRPGTNRALASRSTAATRCGRNRDHRSSEGRLGEDAFPVNIAREQNHLCASQDGPHRKFPCGPMSRQPRPKATRAHVKSFQEEARSSAAAKCRRGDMPITGGRVVATYADRPP
jgi:hypothetical protein